MRSSTTIKGQSLLLVTSGDGAFVFDDELERQQGTRKTRTATESISDRLNLNVEFLISSGCTRVCVEQNDGFKEPVGNRPALNPIAHVARAADLSLP